MLLVLQGMDTSGKGGVLRHARRAGRPAGPAHHGFKAPTEEERRHDFLWRIEQGGAPEPGIIGVFDRSHYEDVLIARVRNAGAPARRSSAATTRSTRSRARWSTRAPRSSSACCTSPPTSSSERLLARLDDPTKHWKFNPGDVDERPRWAGLPARPTRSPSSAPTPTPRPGTSCPATASGTATSRSASSCSRRCRRWTRSWPVPDFDVATSGRGCRRGVGDAPVARDRVPHRRRDPLRRARCARAARCPGIVEADDLGTYVCKFRGAGQGLKVLVAEVVVGELARAAGGAHAASWSRSTSSREIGQLRGGRGGPGPAHRQHRAEPRRRLPARLVRVRRRLHARPARWPRRSCGWTR